MSVVDEPEGPCARCGSPAEAVLRAPFEWEWYLMTERGLDLPTDGVTIPVCRDCLPRVARIQAAFFEFHEYDEARREAAYEEAFDLLDELDLGVLAGTGSTRCADRESTPS